MGDEGEGERKREREGRQGVRRGAEGIGAEGKLVHHFSNQSYAPAHKA